MSNEKHAVSPFPCAGALRVALNLANRSIVSVQDGAGPTPKFRGVAPGLARRIAGRLGLNPVFVPFDDIGGLMAAMDDRRWDIAFIGADPARGNRVRFTTPYVEIPVTGLVRAESSLVSVDQVDRAGVRIVSVAQSAFDLWLQRNIRHAQLLRASSSSEALQRFRYELIDVMAGLRQPLLSSMNRLPGVRMLTGQFTAIQQAIATPLHLTEAANWLETYILEARQSGLIDKLTGTN